MSKRGYSLRRCTFTPFQKFNIRITPFLIICHNLSSCKVSWGSGRRHFRDPTFVTLHIFFTFAEMPWDVLCMCSIRFGHQTHAKHVFVWIRVVYWILPSVCPRIKNCDANYFYISQPISMTFCTCVPCDLQWSLTNFSVWSDLMLWNYCPWFVEHCAKNVFQAASSFLNRFQWNFAHAYLVMCTYP